MVSLSGSLSSDGTFRSCAPLSRCCTFQSRGPCLAVRRLSATVRTDTTKMNVVVSNLEAVPAGVRQGQPVETPVLEVDDRLATHAHQVVMPASPRIESRRRARVTDLLDQTQFHEHIQDAIHAGPRDGRKPLANLIVDLVRRGVIFSIENGLQHRAPLHGNGKTPLAACPLQLTDSIMFRLKAHEMLV